jgi:hypothetical protein
MLGRVVATILSDVFVCSDNAPNLLFQNDGLYTASDHSLRVLRESFRTTDKDVRRTLVAAEGRARTLRLCVISGATK